MADTMYVVFNADDFGFSAAVNAAVLRAHREGILTSASLMANMAGFAEAVILARDTPRLGLGVHLNCLRGRPLRPAEEVASALGASGAFLDSLPRLAWRAVRGLVRWPEIEREWQAQIDRVTAAGIRPTHLDSEKHCHLLFPTLTRIAARLAARNRIRFLRTVNEPIRCSSGAWSGMGQAGKCRWLSWRSRRARAALREMAIRTPDRFVGIAATGRMTVPYVETMLRQVRAGVIEFMFHPSIEAGETAVARSFLRAQRRMEFETLCAPILKAICAKHGIRAVHYGEIP